MTTAGMYITHQKERFNVAYVGALVAQAGANSNSPVVDNDSVDITIMGRGFNGQIHNPHIDIQLKCTHVNKNDGVNLKYQLTRKNYDDLRAENVIHPKYLAVLVVPEGCDKWANHLDNGLLLNGHCYWVSIKGQPALPVGQQSAVVDLPLSQLLTSTEVIKLLDAMSRGVDP